MAEKLCEPRPNLALAETGQRFLERKGRIKLLGRENKRGTMKRQFVESQGRRASYELQERTFGSLSAVVTRRMPARRGMSPASPQSQIAKPTIERLNEEATHGEAIQPPEP